MKLLRYETIHGGDAFALQLSAEMFAVPVAQAPLYKRPLCWLTLRTENNLSDGNHESAVSVFSVGAHDGIRFLYVPDTLGWFTDYLHHDVTSDHPHPFTILKTDGIAGGRWGNLGTDGLLRLTYDGEEGLFAKSEHWATAFQDSRVVGWVEPSKNAVIGRQYAMDVMRRIM